MEGYITNTMITSFSYGIIPFKAVPTNWGIFFILHYLHLSYSIFHFFIIPFGKSFTYTPIFIFTTRLHDSFLMTSIHDYFSHNYHIMRLHHRWTDCITPQHHIPSFPTLTLINNFELSLLPSPLPLATTPHHVHCP